MVLATKIGRMTVMVATIRRLRGVAYRVELHVDGNFHSAWLMTESIESVMAEYMRMVARIRKQYDRNPNYPDKREPGTA